MVLMRTRDGCRLVFSDGIRFSHLKGPCKVQGEGNSPITGTPKSLPNLGMAGAWAAPPRGSTPRSHLPTVHQPQTNWEAARLG